MPGQELTARERARRRGRRIAIAVFALLLASFTLVCSLQIIWQVWGSPSPVREVSCRQGLRDLIMAVRRARSAAASESGGELAALSRFRSALEPEWRDRPSVGQSCQRDPKTGGALRAIEELRYAEEHAVRYEAVDLASQRRRVEALERELLSDPSD
jgi:hypothetical protein